MTRQEFRAQATDDPATVGPRPTTFKVPLCDGVEAPGQLAEAFGESRIRGGLAVVMGTTVAPGHIRNTLPNPSVIFRELDGRHTGRVARLQQAFEEAGVVAKISADIVIDRWSKLLMVGPWSGV